MTKDLWLIVGVVLTLASMTLNRVCRAASPAEAAQAALADAAKVDPARVKQTRWLTLANVPEAARDDTITAVNYALNAVSRSRLISTPELVGDDLLRLDLASYADLKNPTSYADVFRAWENLAVQDPYFHLQTQVAVAPASTKSKAAQPAGTKTAIVKDAAGNTVAATVAKVTTDGGWVGIDTTAKLRETTTSVGAVLRADWFVAQVLSPGPYYEWSGVPTKETEFLTALGVNLEDINRLAADSAANLFRSGVTGKPRRVVFRPSPIGGVWITQDVGKETPDKDPLRVPINYNGLKYQFDASEIFYSRPNGMWGTALYDAKGERQNAVPPNIATDHSAPPGHQELVPLVSCIRCHELNGGSAGLQPFTDEQTKLPTLDATLSDPQVTTRVAELYDARRLGREMDRAQEDYARAVDAATGLETKEATQAVSAVFGRQVYESVTLGVAAADVGIDDPAEYAGTLNGTADPVLLALQAGRKVNRRSWEASFQESALRSVKKGGEGGDEQNELSADQKPDPLKAMKEPAAPVPPVVKIVIPKTKKADDSKKVADAEK